MILKVKNKTKVNTIKKEERKIKKKKTIRTTSKYQKNLPLVY